MNKTNYTSFWRQFVNSFVPTNYGKYFKVDESDTARFLTKFAVIIYAVIAAAYFFALWGYSVEITGGRFLSAKDGYYYRVSNGELKIDEPILIDDLESGVYVNITDKADYFEGEFMELAHKGYKDILLISRTNRIKASGDLVTGYNSFAAYADLNSTKAEERAEKNAPFFDINGNFVVFTVIGGLMFCFFYPHIAELAAYIYSLAVKLFCRIFKLGVSGGYLKKFCTYAAVPSQTIMLAAYAAFAVMYGTDFTKGSGRPVYLTIEIAAAVLPVVLTVIAAVYREAVTVYS